MNKCTYTKDECQQVCRCGAFKDGILQPGRSYNTSIMMMDNAKSIDGKGGYQMSDQDSESAYREMVSDMANAHKPREPGNDNRKFDDSQAFARDGRPMAELEPYERAYEEMIRDMANAHKMN